MYDYYTEQVATKPDDLTWMCMFADYSLPHIRTPFFMVRRIHSPFRDPKEAHTAACNAIAKGSCMSYTGVVF